MRSWIPKLALALGAAAFLPRVAPGQASTGAKVKITAPTNGATVSGPVKVTLKATGVEIVPADRKSTRLNSSHGYISYAVFCLKKKNLVLLSLLLGLPISGASRVPKP